MSIRVSLLTFMTAIAIVPTAIAQDADGSVTADARCVLAGIRAKELPDSREKSTGLLMELYFIGRLDGRSPKVDVKALLTEQIGKMSRSDFESETARCGNSIKTKGQQITQLGQDLLGKLSGK
jgi:hypothetical protein